MRAIVVLAILLLSVLGSCTSTEGVQISAGAVVGHTLEFEVDGLSAESGSAIGGSLRVTRPSPEFPTLEPGFRLDVTYTDITDSTASASIDYEGVAVGLAPMVRWRPFTSDAGVKPFIDIFLGYSHNFVNVDRSAGALQVSDSGNGGGLWYGIGAGVEIPIAERLGLELSVEGVWLDSEVNGIGSIDESRVQGFVGLSHRF